MEIRCLQEALRKAYGVRDDARGVYATFTWLVEELGEVAETILNGDRAAAEEEIADLLAWTLSLASMLGVDAEKALAKKYGNIIRGQGCGNHSH